MLLLITHHSLYIYKLASYSKAQFSFLPQLFFFIYAFIYNSEDTWISILLGGLHLLLLLCFDAWFVPDLTRGTCFKLILMSLWHFTYYSLSNFNCQAQKGSSRLILYFPPPHPESTIYPRIITFTGKKVFRNQDLGTNYSHCYWNIIAFSSL